MCALIQNILPERNIVSDGKAINRKNIDSKVYRMAKTQQKSNDKGPSSKHFFPLGNSNF